MADDTRIPAENARIPQQPIAITIPGFAITWGKIVAVCGTILVAVGASLWGLIGIVYGNMHEGLTRVETKVEELQRSMTAAAKDAGSFQQLLNEAPDLKKNIQETHDAVLRQEVQLGNMNSKLDGLNKTVDGVPASLSEIRIRLTNIESTIQRIPGLPK